MKQSTVIRIATGVAAAIGGLFLYVRASRPPVINLVNSGTRDGERDTATGHAIVADEDANARLKVSFFGPLYTGDYWVLDRGEDYDWSIVGEPSGRYLWLLHREARHPPATLQALFERVEALGYDRWALRITQQPA